MTLFLPNAGQPLVDPKTGYVTGPYRRWMQAANDALNSSSQPVEPVTPDYPSFVLSGAGSVTADGSVAGGEFTVTLVGDEDSPPPNSFYGATIAGEKGFVPVYDALAEGQGIAIRDSGYVVIDTVETPDDLPLTGNAGEAVRVTGAEPGLYAWDGSAFTLDPAADGTVTVTCDATAAEIPYDNSTSGLAATDAQAAIDEVAGSVGGAGAWIVQKKTADEARVSSTTLTDDAALKFACTAGQTYLVRVKAVFNIANATMDFKYALAFSAAFTEKYTIRKAIFPGPVGTDNEFIQASGAIINTSQPIVGTNSGMGVVETETCFTATAGGTFSVQWAQNTSDPGAATMLAGSYLEYMAL